jgi:hypothetical protein
VAIKSTKQHQDANKPAAAVITGDGLNHADVFSKPQHLHALVHIRAQDVVSEGGQLADVRVTVDKRNTRKTTLVPFVNKNFAEARHAWVHALHRKLDKARPTLLQERLHT